MESNKEKYIELFKKAELFAEISDAELERFVDNTRVKTLEAGDIYLRQGEVPTTIAFIIKGLMRKFYTDQKGNEFTKLFSLQYDFSGSLAAFLEHKESLFSVEALEETNLVEMDYDFFREGVENEFCWLKLYNRALEKFYLIKERREGQLLLDDAAARYQQFLKDYPGLEGRVKQYHIASYLGITPVSLSRIRQELKL